MKLSKTDSIALTAGLLIIATFSILFYLDVTRRLGAGDTEVIGEVIFKTNAAQRKYAQQVVWEPITTKATLYNYDTIRTSDLSEAVLKLKDGTEISMTENSMILLTLSSDEFDIKFLGGGISAKRKKTEDKDIKVVNITSGDSKISIDNSDVSVSKNIDKKLNVTVNRGNANLNIGDEKKVIEENQSVVATDEGLRLYNLTIKLVSPDNNTYLPVKGNTLPVAFSWEKIGAQYDVTLEISGDLSFGNIYKRLKSNGNAATVNLNEGIYYWRVVALNRNTKKMEYSESRKLSLIGNRPVQLISPAQRSIIRFRNNLPMINFLWSKNESSSGYTIVIATDARLGNPLVNTNVQDNSIALDTLGEGTYYWKVRNVLELGGDNTPAESAVGTFTVKRTDKLQPPQPTYPPDGKSITRKLLEQKGIAFSWDKKQEIPSVRIVISGDPGFKKVVYNRSVKENLVNFQNDLEEGTYYWRLTGIANDEEITEPSFSRRFKIVKAGLISLITPPNGEVIVQEEGEERSSVEFAWANTGLDGTYKLEVSRTRGFERIEKVAEESGTMHRIRGLASGAYYWRVKLVDSKGEELMKSGIASFDVLTVLERPVAVSPEPGSTVNMLKKKTLDLKWKRVRGANLYKIRLYNIDGGVQRSVLTTESRDDTFSFSDLNMLDDGKFMWTVQALEMSDNMRRVRRKSEEVKVIFTITSGIKDKKIDIKSPDILYVD